MKTFYIYKIRNHINKKIYIGQTDNPKRRWQQHLLVVNGGPIKYKKKYSYVHAAINKYGLNNFSFEIIETALDAKMVSDLEIKWIKFYSSNKKELGYNLTIGGENLSGSNNPMYGKHHTEETKKAYSVQRKLEGRGLGIKNPKVKLTEEQVSFIKHSKLKTKILALMFNVDRTIIQRIRSGKIWKHIP